MRWEKKKETYAEVFFSPSSAYMGTLNQLIITYKRRRATCVFIHFELRF